MNSPAPVLLRVALDRMDREHRSADEARRSRSARRASESDITQNPSRRRVATWIGWAWR